MPWLTQDRDRLDAFRRGDPTVLAEVYQHYVGVVVDVLTYGFSFQGGGQSFRFHGFRTPFELDDALQETFYRAFSPKGRQAFDGLRPFRNYLLTIARNLTIDRLRKRKLEQRLCTPEDSAESDAARTAPAESPEHGAMLRQLRQLIADFKAELDEPTRALFELRFEQGLSRAAVCEQLGLGPMQIRTRERKLRHRIADRLQQGGWHSGADAQALLLLVLIATSGVAELEPAAWVAPAEPSAYSALPDALGRKGV